MGSVKKMVKSWMTHEEIVQAEQVSKLLILGIETLRGSISHTLHDEMEKQHLSFNEVARALDISENMASKMLYGKGSINFDTIVRLSNLTGKVPYIAWKDPEDIFEDDLPIKRAKQV